MANGIDSIYDPSDVSRMLAEMRQQRLEMEDARRRKTKGATEVATTAWDIWSKEQSTKMQELLGTKDYVMDPEYTKKNWLGRAFTPSGGRVVPTEEFSTKLANWESTGKITEGGRSSFRLPSGEVIGTASIPEDIRGPKTIKESISGTVESAGSKIAEKGSGWGGGVGAGLSLYETMSDWEGHKKDPVKRGLDVAKTSMYAASMVPGAHSPFALAGAGVLSLADLLWG